MKKKSSDIEREAHIFAACILIPKKFILEDIKNGFDLTDDEQMKALCKKYEVSLTTMTFRLSLLKHQL